ncbi:prephenate dehydrogenase/arogenate dehydrogenase family protein [Candidatus Nardonella dryophthoridicola]|uniref:prephenate dehydrogenase/arogenate dehydrogenase family protein n=1 Tax=Candidatus Nardonella dryophthoridicola TaxID=1971485 RepID=UPI001AD88CD6|nr:prephenate dehydrogenase/arogenate dehydrogenase family protein [Candidatus Nardonella dryophthoridicola]QTJ62895.1 prephenate dehydrogenase/arogenate dehydrogenase family protein [Candidatus Nardonella dryophthoridicola]
MKSILDDVRNSIDIIDNKILDLVNERFELIKKIGLLKFKYNIILYDKNREKKIIRNKILNNINNNISNNFIYNLFKIFFFESYKIQLKIINNKKSIKSNKNIVIIGGTGKIGKIFFNILDKKGYNVFSINSKNWDCFNINKADLIIISVPISKFKFIFDKVITICKEDCILVDVLSNKSCNIKYAKEKYNGPILSIHPMFGPKINNFIKKKILYINIKFKDKYIWFIDLLKEVGFILYEIDSVVEHDNYMKYIQSLRYLFFLLYSNILLKSNLNINKIIKYSPFNNEILIYLFFNFCSQNIDLYLEIINSNFCNNFDIINNLINDLMFLKLNININNKNLINKYSFLDNLNNFPYIKKINNNVNKLFNLFSILK